MKKYYIRDENGSLHYMKAKNLKDAMSKLTSSVKDSTTDGFNAEGMKKHIPSILKDVKEAYSLVLRSAKDWVVQVPEDLEYLANRASTAAKKFREVSKQYFTDSVKTNDKNASDYYNKLDRYFKSKYPEMKWEMERVGYARVYDPKTMKIIKSGIPVSSILLLSKDSVKDDVVSNYFYFDLDDLSMSLDNAVNIMKNCGLTIVKIDKRNKEAKVYYRGASAAEQKAADKLDISLDDSINDTKTKDEANLPTTIQALVNDEEAAIKSYEVAIKNLEGKIDETQMQVLINIMKDERRHVENLYAILNGQVTEKNLEDSIHDGNDICFSK